MLSLSESISVVSKNPFLQTIKTILTFYLSISHWYTTHKSVYDDIN